MTDLMMAVALGGMGLTLASGAAAQTAPATSKADQAAAMFAKADSDGDGALSAAEWKAAGRRDRGFAMADTDKDGKVTADELRALAAKHGR